MGIYAGSVKIRKRDNTLSVTVDNIVISGDQEFDMKRNPDNLKRALKYMKGGNKKGEDFDRWVIVEIVIYKRLDTFPIVTCYKPYIP